MAASVPWRSLFRVLLAAFAAASGWIGLYFHQGSRRLQADHEAAREALLLDLPVDLARPGVHEGLLAGDYPRSHGYALQLLLPPASPAGEARGSLEGLAMTLGA